MVYALTTRIHRCIVRIPRQRVGRHYDDGKNSSSPWPEPLLANWSTWLARRGIRQCDGDLGFSGQCVVSGAVAADRAALGAGQGGHCKGVTTIQRAARTRRPALRVSHFRTRTDDAARAGTGRKTIAGKPLQPALREQGIAEMRRAHQLQEAAGLASFWPALSVPGSRSRDRQPRRRAPLTATRPNGGQLRAPNRVVR
jgi:hypothetical protein